MKNQDPIQALRRQLFWTQAALGITFAACLCAFNVATRPLEVFSATNEPTQPVSLAGANWTGTLDDARLPADVPLLADLGSGSPIDLNVNGAILQGGNPIAYGGEIVYGNGEPLADGYGTLYYGNGAPFANSETGNVYSPSGSTLADSLGNLYYNGGSTLATYDGYLCYSSGYTLAAADGTLYYYNGTILADPYGDLLYANGESLASANTLYYSNGSTLADLSGSLYYGSGNQLADINSTLYHGSGSVLSDINDNVYASNFFFTAFGSPLGSLYTDGTSLFYIDNNTVQHTVTLSN